MHSSLLRLHQQVENLNEVLRLIVPQLQRQINLFHTDKTVTRSSPTSPTLLSSTRNRISDWNNFLSLKFLSKSCLKIVCILTMLYCTTSSLHSNGVTLMLFHGKFLLQKLSLILPSHCVQSKVRIYYCYQNS